MKKSDRIKELEAEVYGLKVKLDRAESKLAQAGVSDSKAREKELERELKESQKRNLEIKAEKVALLNSVEELQKMLTMEQQKNRETEQGLADLNDPQLMSVEHSIKRSERERELEVQLIRAKREKEKAVRLVVTLIGKDNIAEFLNEHAGSPSLLDELIRAYAPSMGRYISTGQSSARQTTSATHQNHSPRSPRKTGNGHGLNGNGKVKSTLVGSPDPSRNRVDNFF